ncbi:MULTISPECIES: hypothetical protein [Streptomyces]|nr:hypothetical protein [Streptomyces canarius]
MRLEQLREQLAARIERAATAPRTDRLTEFAPARWTATSPCR